VNTTTNRVGIFNANPSHTLHVTGNVVASTMLNAGGSSSLYTLLAQSASSTNREAARVVQNDTVNNPRAMSIVNAGTNYGLKVDHNNAASILDAVNITSAATAGTSLGITAVNTSLSTLKVSNSGAQTSGAVVGAEGTSTSRTAGVFRAEAAGGFCFDGLCTNAAAVGLHLKAAASQSADMVTIKNTGGTPIASVDATGSVRSTVGVGTQHVGAGTPTGGQSGDIRVGTNKLWVNDAGNWKSVAVA
jgi:hypothetical protein